MTKYGQFYNRKQYLLFSNWTRFSWYGVFCPLGGLRSATFPVPFYFLIFSVILFLFFFLRLSSVLVAFFCFIFHLVRACTVTSAICSFGTKVKNGAWTIDCSSRLAMTRSSTLFSSSWHGILFLAILFTAQQLMIITAAWTFRGINFLFNRRE